MIFTEFNYSQLGPDDAKQIDRLITSLQRYEYVFQATSDAIWDWEFDAQTVYWGKGFERAFGHATQRKNPNPDAWSDLIHPEDKAFVLASIHGVIDNPNENIWRMQYRFCKANGDYAYVDDRGLILRDPNGRALRMIGAMRDISESKAIEQQLQLLESVVTHTQDAVIITEAEPLDEPGPRILYVNQAFTRMTGYTAAEVIGKNPRFLQGSLTQREELEKLSQSLHNWQTCEVELLNYTKNGEPFWVQFSVMPVADHKGWYTHWFAIQRDISEQKFRSQRAELLNQIRSAFNQNATLTSALLATLDLLQSSMRCAFGEVWLKPAGKDYLRIVAQTLTSQDLEPFGHQEEKMWQIKIGEGFPGKVWATQDSVFLDDLGNQTVFLRHKLAQKTGLKNLFGLPLNLQGETIGVLVLGSQDDLHARLLSPLSLSFGEQLANEIQFKQLEQEQIQIFQFTPDVLCISDREGQFRRVNPAMARLLNYSESDMLQLSIAQVLHAEDRDKIWADLQDGLQSQRLYSFEGRFLTQTGEIRWLAWTSACSEQEDLIYSAARDITQAKILELQLAKAYREKSIVLESIGDAFLTFNPDYIVTYWNQKAAELTQTPKEEVLNKCVWDIFPDAVENFKPYYEKAFASHQPVHFEEFFHRLNVWFEISAYPSELGLSVYFRDITQRKETEIHLAQLNQELERHVKALALSNRELEQFAYIASHDLQEPLRMITSFLGRLEQKYKQELDEKAQRYIHFAVDGAQRMRSIIQDLLEFSRLSKVEQLAFEKLDLNVLLEEITHLLRKKIHDSKAQIDWEPLPQVNFAYSSARQLFQNLIENALKYVEPGVSPVIHIAVQEHSDKWIFSVADNGIGIEAEYFDKIFVIFQRLHSKDEYSGNGMGLAMCKKIVEQFGGHIWLESEPCKGSTFYFSLMKNRENKL